MNTHNFNINFAPQLILMTETDNNVAIGTLPIVVVRQQKLQWGQAEELIYDLIPTDKLGFDLEYFRKHLPTLASKYPDPLAVSALRENDDLKEHSFGKNSNELSHCRVLLNDQGHLMSVRISGKIRFVCDCWVISHIHAPLEILRRTQTW